MKEKLKNLPNFITALRIAGTLSLLFTKPLTLWFYIIYFFTGLTDVLDGFVARKLNLTSTFGAKLDSIADLIFYTVMFIMIMPALIELLPVSLWCCVAIVVLLRLSAYITAGIKLHKFAATHSVLNKATGACIFAIPLILTLPFAVTICWIVCAVSGLASATELVQYLKI